MSRSAAGAGSAAGTPWRVLLALVCAAGVAAPAAAKVTAVKASLTRPQPAISASSKPDPDALLIEVYKELSANHLREAQAKADALVEAYPNFHLGHLVRGDLLLMHTQPVTSLGGAAAGAPDKLKNLRHEAAARLRALSERPDPSLVPRALLQLREDQKYALVVDAARSRLYVYQNVGGGQLKFVTDYYISQGKYGVNKLREGDQRTPLGVYYITQRLAGARLPDFYGTGALPISYPNEWDKLNGRSGSGIWLHGTPSDSYSRPPLSSDGCVVLTNPDLNKLYGSVEIGKTPVIISDKVEFVTRAKWEADRSAAAKLVDNWKRDVESLDPARVRANYSARFKSEQGEALASWFEKQQKAMRGVRNMTLTLKDSTFFLYPGQENLIVGTFTQDAQIGKSRHSVRKRQYWAKEGQHWKIVAESNW
jgi:murein L,D-transpeptidase YafK